MVTLEQVLDLISTKIIETASSDDVNPEQLLKNQKTIRNGSIAIGRSEGERLLLFSTDVRAHKEDLNYNLDVATVYTSGNGDGFIGGTLQTLVDDMNHDALDISQVQCIISSSPFGATLAWNGKEQDITSVISYVDDTEDGQIILNPLNIGQFVNFNKVQENIDPALAEEFLDTNIYELLPDASARQKRIDEFFNEFQNLTNPPPDFLMENGLVGQDFDPNNYHWNNDISATQEDNEATIDEAESMITRLDFDANNVNQGKTLESLRDSLNQYLKDIDEDIPAPTDERPEYENQSEGYLKFRQPNQGIIVRNVNQDFISGLNPNTQEYLETGFTITMWVRFIDKVSSGTLFNFGNPFRDDGTEFGFTLDTFILNADDDISDYGNSDYTTWQEWYDGNNTNITKYNLGTFKDFKAARFLRLSVVEDDGTLRDSHTGVRYDGADTSGDKILVPTLPPSLLTSNINNLKLPHNVQLPIDSNEWYFIVATYNPDIDEPSPTFSDMSVVDTDNSIDPDFWNGNIKLDGNYTHSSGYGNRCKVEFISRTDLLRARGYKE